jgi:hypothetical protein
MLRNVRDINKLFREGIKRSKEAGILPANFKKRTIPLGKLILLFKSIYIILLFSFFFK